MLTGRLLVLLRSEFSTLLLRLFQESVIAGLVFPGRGLLLVRYLRRKGWVDVVFVLFLSRRIGILFLFRCLFFRVTVVIVAFLFFILIL